MGQFYQLFYQLVNNFLVLLLCKMHFLDILNIADFFQIFGEDKNQLVSFEKPTDQFSLLIGLYLYENYID